MLEGYGWPVEIVPANALDRASLLRALAQIDDAYYLVHCESGNAGARSGGQDVMSGGISRVRRRDLLGLGGFVVVCLAISAIGGWVTAQTVGTWYRTLQKPEFNPPDWVFAPVWTLLYVLIAVAGWRVWRRRGFGAAPGAAAAYATQLALNLAWSFIFFAGRMIGAALADIVLLLAAIAITAALFRRIDRVAAWLLAPYGAWVAFAAVLNHALWRLN